MSKYTLGPDRKRRLQAEHSTYQDAEFKYAIGKSYVLGFFHVPTGEQVQFKAMIDGFSDKYTSEWNKEKVYGRNDPIQTFQGTERTLSLSWKVVAADLAEAEENLKRVSTLLRMLYPSYETSASNAGQISAAPLFKVSFANLIRNQDGKLADGKGATDAQLEGLVGSINGFSYEPNMEAGFFDPSPAILYPQEITLSCEITVLHTHPLGWAKRRPRANGFQGFPYGEGRAQGTPIREVGNARRSSNGTKNQQTARVSKLTT